jgi:hypothetical protein
MGRSRPSDGEQLSTVLCFLDQAPRQKYTARNVTIVTLPGSLPMTCVERCVRRSSLTLSRPLLCDGLNSVSQGADRESLPGAVGWPTSGLKFGQLDIDRNGPYSTGLLRKVGAVFAKRSTEQETR